MPDQRRPFAARNAFATAYPARRYDLPDGSVTVSLESQALPRRQPPNPSSASVHHGRDVLRVLEVFVVEERDEPVRVLDPSRTSSRSAPRRLERGDGLRPSVQRLEVLEDIP
jgi:hypothetical protein